MATHNGNGGAAQIAASELGEVTFRACGGRRPRVLAHGGYSAKHLVLDERYIYWTDGEDGTVTRLPKDGGVPLILATDQAQATELKIAGGWLYWVLNRAYGRGAVVRMPAEGGDVEVIAGGQENPEALAIHGDTVVWTTCGDGLATGTVCQKRLDGGPVVTLATRQKQPRSIALDAECIYWTNFGNKRPGYFTDGSVVRMPRDGGKKRYILAKDQSMPHSITMDGDWFYWTTSAEIYEPYSPGAILKRRKGEKRTIRLVEWGREHGLLAVDATHVYWFQEFGGVLVRVPKEGGEPEPLLLQSSDPMLRVQSFAVDDRCVYWAASDSRTAGGAIFKMAK